MRTLNPLLASRRRGALARLAIIVGLLNIVSWANAKAPNIILIASDDAGYNSFGFSAALLGNSPPGETPNLDALAAQSVVLKQGYSSSSLCSPSRAGLLTGMTPARLGFETNLSSAYNYGAQLSGDKGLTADQLTIAERLKGLGYNTGMVGKWHLGYDEGLNRPLDKGFDEFFGFLGGGRQYFDSGGEEQSMRRGNTIIESEWRSEGDTSRYDPVQGRYTTDAFGEEAVSFINNQSDSDNPFFLYLAFNAQHSPWGAKQADLNHFSHIADPNVRMQAAILYAMDRAVGDVMQSLVDNGIDDETIIVFTNDDGPAGPSEGNSYPLKGTTGTLYEGESRVPFFVRMPGVAAGSYNKPMSAVDVLPTLYAAAGGDVSQIETDGHDMRAYLAGEAVEDPNTARFWRLDDNFAVRRGDWKLTSGFNGSQEVFLYNIATDPNESVNQLTGQPAMSAQLFAELTHWEATVQKMKWGHDSAPNQNRFDHFVFRTDLATTEKWSTLEQWFEAGTTHAVRLLPADAYANAILEFQVRNDADYTATNDMRRTTKQTFMLNELRLTGAFAGTTARRATIDGKALLFVKSLAGAAPQIRLDATGPALPATFRFEVNTELQLLDTLTISGNGTQDFVIGGAIRDYYEPLSPNLPQIYSPHDVVKTGSSRVTLRGYNTFGGTLTVSGGSVTVDGPTAGIVGAAAIQVDAGAVTLQSGAIDVGRIAIGRGGSFNFNGGALSFSEFTGDLVVNGGAMRPRATTRIAGNFLQAAGALEIQIGGPTISESSHLEVSGIALLGGDLRVELTNDFQPTLGQAFQFLRSESLISGSFAEIEAPELPDGMTWNLLVNNQVAALIVGPDTGLGDWLPGDYNDDHHVDAADYSIWRDAVDTGNLSADGNFDGTVDNADFEIWRAAFGLSNANSGGIVVTTVPEPSFFALSALGAAAILLFYLARRVRSGGSSSSAAP